MLLLRNSLLLYRYILLFSLKINISKVKFSIGIKLAIKSIQIDSGPPFFFFLYYILLMLYRTNPIYFEKSDQ